MTLKNSIIFLFIVLSLIFIGAGLWIAGGPSSGKAEKRDAVRMEDLRELRDLTFCLAETANGVLPDEVDMTDACRRDISLADPYSGDAYTFARISARAYKWCAEFELPDRIRTYGNESFDTDTGCVQFTYRP